MFQANFWGAIKILNSLKEIKRVHRREQAVPYRTGREARYLSVSTE
jgi:hypothetical protein